MPTIRSATLFSLLTNYGSVVIGFGATVVLSRLLSPSAIGAYAVSLAFITIVQTVLDFNIVNYGVKAKQVTRPLLNSMTGLSLALYVPAVTLLLIALPLVARYWGGGDVRHLLAIMLPALLVGPFAVSKTTVLRREFRLRELLLPGFMAALARALVGIALVLQGYGVVALAYAYALSRFVEVIGICAVDTPHPFPRPSFKGWRELIGFASATTAAQLIGTLGFALAELLIGHYLSLAAAGYYNRGALLTNIYRTGVERAVFPVAFTAFSSEASRKGGDPGRVYLDALALVTGVAWPAFAVLAIFARPMVSTLFGSAWLPCVPVAQILAVACAVYTLTSLVPNFAAALGAARSFLLRELAVQAPRLALLWSATSHGISAIAGSVLATYLLAVTVDQIALRRISSVTAQLTCRAIACSVAVCVSVMFAAALAAACLNNLVVPESAKLIIGLIVSGCAWIAALWYFHHPLRREVCSMAVVAKRASGRPR